MINLTIVCKAVLTEFILVDLAFRNKLRVLAGVWLLRRSVGHGGWWHNPAVVMCGWIGYRVWVLPSNSSEVLAPRSAYWVVFGGRHCWLAAALLLVCLLFGVCPSRIILCQLDFCSRQKKKNAALASALQLPTALIALCDTSFVNMKLPCRSGWTRRSSPSHLHQWYDSLFSHSCTHFRLLLYGVTRRTCGLFSFLYLYYLCVCVRVWLVIGKCVASFFCPQPCSLNFTQFTVQRLKHSCNIPNVCVCCWFL